MVRRLKKVTQLFTASTVSMAIANVSFADPNVACVQEFLNFNSYNAGPVDGLLGSLTQDAAANFQSDTTASLPALSDNNADVWCDFAKDDPDFAEFSSFQIESTGVVSRRIIFEALQNPLERRVEQCGRVSDSTISRLSSEAPISSISGYNSRMDNNPPFAREAEDFVADFARASMSAFITEDSNALSTLTKILANWAENNAFLETINCVQADGYLSNVPPCTQWLQDDGQDLSGLKDWSFTAMLMAGLARNYYITLANHEPVTLAAEHRAIKQWLSVDLMERLPTPRQVYFGVNMAYYWPWIIHDFNRGRTDLAWRKLGRLSDGLQSLINEDGSITDRTTRGNRALWYHYTSIGEVVVSLEIMRATGFEIPERLEILLHSAVSLFLSAINDYSVLDQWASQAHNGIFRPGQQDWMRNSWQHSSFGGSWLHIYPYRYPDNQNSLLLKQAVGESAGSATSDIDLGVGVGCLYNLANASL